ncbi:MAG: aspartyl protease family protein [Pseudomonadota bacterium]
MFKFISLLILLVLVAGAGWYFAYEVDTEQAYVVTQPSAPVQRQSVAGNDVSDIFEITNDPEIAADPEIESGISWADTIAAELQALLAASRWRDAIAKITSNYSRASASELERFKAMVLQYADQLLTKGAESAASSLLKEYTQAFDELTAWKQLAELSLKTQDWDNAITSLLAYSAQENQPEAFEQSLRSLVRAGNYVRATLERQGDEAGILALYQRIYDQHPQYPRFQLELANAHLRLNDPDSARPLLENLSYDPKLGIIAQETLARMNSQRQAELDALTQAEPETPPPVPSTDIAVPLIRSGSSLLVDVSVNSVPMRLLLDTGASITALSSEVIQDLGLRPNGTVITLNTANGRTQSRLYRTDRLRLGRLQLNDMVVAEIDLPSSRGIAGLLGTDVLNQMNEQFSYLIDDENNALIFRQR